VQAQMKYLQIVLSSCSIVGSRAHAKDVLQEAYFQVDAVLSYQFPTWARLSLNVFNLLDSAYFEASTCRSDVQQAVNPPLLSILIVTCRLKRPRYRVLTQAVCNVARRHVYSN
jgi:outer membrane receptor for monomeric catechols